MGGRLPLPQGEGWGEGLRSNGSVVTPSPQPSAQTRRGSLPSSRHHPHHSNLETKMPATALDSLIFRDIFSTAEMRHVFSDEARTGYYLEVEAALARAQGKLGIIPENAMHE